MARVMTMMMVSLLVFCFRHGRRRTSSIMRRDRDRILMSKTWCRIRGWDLSSTYKYAYPAGSLSYSRSR